jgi:N-acyl-D-aspartate/D-glutamate deacylase
MTAFPGFFAAASNGLVRGRDMADRHGRQERGGKAMAEFDTVIRGGTIVDGTGAAPVEGDVAVTGGRIAAVGQVKGSGREEIDARGRLVTPGFVDIHTHYDGQAIWSSRMAPSSNHGVTTVVMGNCGVGFAPCRAGDHDMLIGVMEGVEDIPGAVMAEGLTWEWESFPEYLDAVDKRPHDIDLGVFFPHSPLRVYAMGKRGADREVATEADLAKMRHLTREAVQAGALGFATSRQFVHRTRDGAYVPSYHAAEAELTEICRGMTDAGQGLIQIVMDLPVIPADQEIDMLARVAQATGRPATFSYGAPNTPTDDWRPAIAQLHRLHRQGVDITAQVFPRPIGMTLGFNLTVNPFCLCESYQPLAKLPLAERVKELRRDEVRKRLLNEPPGKSPSVLATVGRNFDYMFPVSDPIDYEPAPDTSIAAQAGKRGITPEELAYDMLLADDGNAMLYVFLGNYQGGKQDGLYEMLRDDRVCIGLGDGGAHYGMICDGSYPTTVLSHWTRDRAHNRMPIEFAVKALAAEPARVVGFLDRGVLARGYKADLNIIDHGRIKLHVPEVRHDLPAGGRRLNQRAEGYDLTMVAGKVTYRNGQPTRELPGRVVRGMQSAPE